MDQKFMGLTKALQDSNDSLFISCIVQGVLITGFVIAEQKYFVETNRIMNDETQSSSESRAHWEEIMLKIAKLPIENAALHLAGVKMYLPTGIQSFPTLRVDPSQVSAWTFLVPGNQDSYAYLPQIFGEKPDASG